MELVNEVLLLVDVDIVERLNVFSADPETRNEVKQEVIISSKKYQ